MHKINNFRSILENTLIMYVSWGLDVQICTDVSDPSLIQVTRVEFTVDDPSREHQLTNLVMFDHIFQRVVWCGIKLE